MVSFFYLYHLTKNTVLLPYLYHNFSCILKHNFNPVELSQYFLLRFYYYDYLYNLLMSRFMI